MQVWNQLVHTIDGEPPNGTAKQFLPVHLLVQASGVGCVVDIGCLDVQYSMLMILSWGNRCQTSRSIGYAQSIVYTKVDARHEWSLYSTFAVTYAYIVDML